MLAEATLRRPMERPFPGLRAQISEKESVAQKAMREEFLTPRMLPEQIATERPDAVELLGIGALPAPRFLVTIGWFQKTALEQESTATGVVGAMEGSRFLPLTGPKVAQVLPARVLGFRIATMRELK